MNKILNGTAALSAEVNKHCGAVKTIDCNPFKKNLIASGSSESEIFIWDANNLNAPMTPGKKTEPLETVAEVAWNLQVQHILGMIFI